LHHPQRQPRELVRAGPPDVIPRLARLGQGLGHERRLADAWLALDPDHRSLTPAESLDAGAENFELIFATNPLRCTSRQHAGDYALPVGETSGHPGRLSGAGQGTGLDVPWP
jgi:hypothetical protein